MNEKTYVTPFYKDEKRAIAEMKSCLINKNDVPVDIAHRINIISVHREYYPLAVYDIIGDARWNATSYWEHREEYQVSNTKNVYYSYDGHEYSTPGYDYNPYEKRRIYRTARPKVEYVTKYKTVTDNVQLTSGIIPATKFNKMVWLGNPIIGSISEWAEKTVSSNKIVDDDYFSNYEKQNEMISKESAESIAKHYVEQKLGIMSENEVPGNRYTDLVVESRIKNVEKSLLYLGVFRIVYEYNGNKYECIIFGGYEKYSFFNNYPVDVSIKERLDSLQTNADVYGSTMGCFISLIIILVFGFTIYAFLSDDLVDSAVVTFIIILVVMISMAIIMGVLSEKKKNEIMYHNEYSKIIKNEINKVTLDNSISEDKKEYIIGKMICDSNQMLDKKDNKPKFCNRCGFEVGNTDRFCTKCGNRLS